MAEESRMRRLQLYEHAYKIGIENPDRYETEDSLRQAIKRFENHPGVPPESIPGDGGGQGFSESPGSDDLSGNESALDLGTDGPLGAEEDIDY